MARHLAFIGSHPPVGGACDDWPATTIEAVNSCKKKRGSRWQPPPLLLCASGGAKSRAAELGAGFECSARPPSYRGRGMGISPTSKSAAKLACGILGIFKVNASDLRSGTGVAIALAIFQAALAIKAMRLFEKDDRAR